MALNGPTASSGFKKPLVDSLIGQRETAHGFKYRESLTTYNKKIRKAKRKNYRDFCENIENTTEGARLHRALSKKAPEANLALKRGDNTYFSSNIKKLELLFETHFLGSIPIQKGTNLGRPEDRVRPVSDDWAIAKSTITLERLEWAVGTFQPYKSPVYHQPSYSKGRPNSSPSLGR